MYDVIVVGAGPSGALAAKKCAELGLKVVIIEKERIPRTKSCGGGVSAKALELVGSSIPRHLIAREVKGFRFFSTDLQ